jgi:hypothetical protein
MHLQEVANMSIMEINGLVLYIYHLLTYITNWETIEQLHRWIYNISHAIRKGEYGKQLKVLTGTNGESKIRKQPINLSEMYENNNELEDEIMTVGCLTSVVK